MYHKHLKIKNFMKKVALFSMVVLFSTALLTSCSSDCYTCGSGTGLADICKKDYEASGASAILPWSTYVTSLKAAGCTAK